MEQEKNIEEKKKLARKLSFFSYLWIVSLIVMIALRNFVWLFWIFYVLFIFSVIYTVRIILKLKKLDKRPTEEKKKTFKVGVKRVIPMFIPTIILVNIILFVNGQVTPESALISNIIIITVVIITLRIQYKKM